MNILGRKILAKTPFLDLVEVSYRTSGGEDKHWYGVSRNNAKYAVLIAAVTKNKELIFVRQPRAMVGSHVIEFPAGLSDIPGETAIDVAKREILEETGFSLYNCQVLIGGENGLTVSSGLSDERVILVVGKDAVKTAEPLPDESTEPILVPIDKAEKWLFEMTKTNDVDFKSFGIVKIIRDWLGG